MRTIIRFGSVLELFVFANLVALSAGWLKTTLIRFCLLLCVCVCVAMADETCGDCFHGYYNMCSAVVLYVRMCVCLFG